MTTAQLINAEAEFAARNIHAAQIVLTTDSYYGTWVEALDARGASIDAQYLYGGDEDMRGFFPSI